MISILAAVAKNGVIGKDNALPWYLPEDLKRFKQLTLGKSVLMGSKTYESIIDKLGKPLPNRKNIVVSRDTNYKVAPGVLLYNSLDVALGLNLGQNLGQHKNEDLFIIGGASIYKQTLDYADKLYITHINREVEGDTYFPKVDMSKWKLAEEDEHDGFSFVTYKRS